MVDMFVGALSLSLVESLALFGVSEAPSFLQVFVTTLVQGVLLNIVLLGYMTAVYGILRLIAALRRSRVARLSFDQPLHQEE
jgi:hypothetical protein